MFARLGLILLIVLAMWGATARGSNASGDGGGYYVVRAGDTLWSISDRFYEGDARKGVWQLQHQNDLDSGDVIAPGDRLRLPW